MRNISRCFLLSPKAYNYEMCLCAALPKNAAEAKPGVYLGTDIEPTAGFLLDGAYSTVGRIVYVGSIKTLKQIRLPIDVFINDSDHSSDYEGREYETVEKLLHPKSIILGDNSHSTPRLMEFAEKTQ